MTKRKVIEYLIEGGHDPEDLMCTADDRTQLIANVDLALKAGWQPLGAPFLDKEGCMCQAMVMYKEV